MMRVLTIWSLALWAMCSGAYAQGLSLSSSGNMAASPLDRVKRASRVIDGRLSEQYSTSVRLLPNHKDKDGRRSRDPAL